MENSALITVIVPIYNGEKYISECINSILNQDYANLEVILVNDGSQDNSPNIMDEYAATDNRIRVIHQENAGVSVARNTALDNAHGEYVCFVDQDDWIAKDYISYLYRLLTSNDVEIAMTPQANRFNSTDSIVDDTVIDNVKIWSGCRAAKEMLYYNVIIAPWNKMISRDLIETNAIRFNPEFFGGEGFNFSVDCFQRAKNVAVGSRRVYFYRVDNPESGMARFSINMTLSSIKAVKHIEEKLVIKTSELLRACRYANWHTHCDMYNTMIGSGATKQYPDVYKMLKKITQKEALCVLNATISNKDKAKGIVYFINPYLAACIINKFRLRKFTKCS